LADPRARELRVVALEAEIVVANKSKGQSEAQTIAETACVFAISVGVAGET
jgi:hypothetical protein